MPARPAARRSRLRIRSAAVSPPSRSSRSASSPASRREASRFDVTFGYENPNQVAVVVQVGTGERRRSHADRPRAAGRLRSGARRQRVHRARSPGGGAGRLDGAALRPDRDRRLQLVPGPVRAEPRPIPVEIFPLCARRTGSTYVAVFGYQNLNETTVNVPVRAGEPLRPGVAGSRAADRVPAGAGADRTRRRRHPGRSGGDMVAADVRVGRRRARHRGLGRLSHHRRLRTHPTSRSRRSPSHAGSPSATGSSTRSR